jgi:hypothetical protein
MSEVVRSVPSAESLSVSQSTDGGVDVGAEFAREIKEYVPAAPSENASENGGSGAKKTATKKKNDDAASKAYKRKVAALKAAKPAPKVMIRDIQMAVRSQLNILEKKKNKYKSQGPRGYFKYNKAVAEVRSMRRLLSGLLYRTYEELKALWLRVVHNVA